MSRALMFVFGIVVGVLGVAVFNVQSILQATLTTGGSNVFCANQVRTEAWKTYSSHTYGFTLRYPSDFEIAEESDQILVRPVHATGSSIPYITFTKLRATLKSQLNESMQQAGWKVADRQMYALSSPYINLTPVEVQSTYLFVRDFALTSNPNEAHTIIRAAIHDRIDNPDFRNQKMTIDGEGVLTVPEQILSTFRFLSFEEIYGPAGKQQ